MAKKKRPPGPPKKGTRGDGKTKARTPSQPPRAPRAGEEPSQVAESPDPLAQEPQLVVVGIGASAGGLEVLGQILGGIASDSGAAYVIVQHLSPEHHSALPELLGPKCSIPIVEASHGMELEPNKVFARPANSELGISGHTIRLSPPR